MNPEQNIDDTVVNQPEVTPPVDQTPPAENPQASNAIDPQAIANAAAQAAIAAQQASAPQAPDPNDPENMSDEERAEYFRTFNVTEDFSSGFVSALQPDEEGNVPVQKVGQMFEQFRDGVLAQAMRHTELATERMQQEFQQTISPVQQHFQQQAAERIWDDFSTSHPHLKEYRSMVDQTAAAMRAQGFVPQSQEHLFDTVAQAVSGQLKQINPALEFPTGKQTSPPQTTAPTGMNGTAMAQGTPAPQSSNRNTSEFYDNDVFG